MDGHPYAFSFVAFDFDFASMFPNNSANDQQPEARTRGLSGEVGLKQFAHLALRDAASGIVERDRDIQVTLPGSDVENPAAFHGLKGILDDVIKGLLHLV